MLDDLIEYYYKKYKSSKKVADRLSRNLDLCFDETYITTRLSRIKKRKEPVGKGKFNILTLEEYYRITK